MSDWIQKDTWKKAGKTFSVEVSRHFGAANEWEGRHRWCVYAYIYPTHPHFQKFSGNQMWQDAACALHFHGGPTYLEYPMYDGKVTCVKVGADYHHLYDDRFGHYATKEDAREVFADADELYEQLQTMAEVEEVAQQ